MNNSTLGLRVKKFFKPEIVFVLLLLIIALFLRIYRVDQILAFHYDQGRDALVIWDLLHAPHKLFLIGPTTGLAGVFRGPFYYYLIAPFYWLGRGNPVWPAVFLAMLSVGALGVMYYLGKQIGGVKTGIIALILGSFSFEIIYASRWLSNPTPMLFLSMFLVYSLFKITDGKLKYWVAVAFILGLSFFHFGSSGELFYFPAVAIFALWRIFFTKKGTKNIPGIRIIVLSIFSFIITFLPLVIFNFKHGGILANNILDIVGKGQSFVIPSWRFISDRLSLIFVYLTSTIIHSPYEKEWFHLIMLGIVFVYFLSAMLKNEKFKIIIILLISPVIGLLFYQGNYGNLYQYYLTGYYLIFLLAVAYSLNILFESSKIGKLAVLYFLFYFLSQNISWIKPYINANGEEKNTIVLANQKKAIDWVYENAGNRVFNVDVYVPPVISYSYDYLFKWLGETKYHIKPLPDQVPLLYTIYEVNPDNPDRLQAWLSRQKGIGKVLKEQSFGGITVQERTRIEVK